MSNPVTVQELDELIKAIKTQEDEIEVQKKVLAELNKALYGLEMRAVGYLKELDREEYTSPFGKLQIKQKWRVNLPQTDQEKRDLFEHLRERGIFDKYATVNSASLNALFMADWREATKRGEGMGFSMPGIGAPKLDEKLEFKKTKDQRMDDAITNLIKEQT